jgi:FtsP/CotA-like multicopper oxidase with cupredoxin domain
MPRSVTFAPTLVTRNGRTYAEFTVSSAAATSQVLPPGFPASTVFAYGGQVKIPGSNQTEFVRSVPGPTFEVTRGVPVIVRWRNKIDVPHFLPVDPTLHWTNPNHMERPTAPFIPFPPGYPSAQFPVAGATHMHGLVVPPQMDGTAEEWHTFFGQTGPAFSTRDYVMPNEQPPTHLWYHDHTMGQTRLGLYAGLVGAGYFIRDPANPLDGPGSPLPSGAYEVPLTIFDRSFYTDGEMKYPRTSGNPGAPYWGGGPDGADTIVVNGKVWPNMNVERRQYRFRALVAANRSINFTLNTPTGTIVPSTLIGSDGGYLPAPKVVNNFIVGTSERADFLVDFSPFPAGTKIKLLNAGANVNTVGTVMQFTVVDSPAVPPQPLPTTFYSRPVLTPNAPTRIKFMGAITVNGNVVDSVDGLGYSSPTTEYPLVGSTEDWWVVNSGGPGHMIHLHLIEFQVLGRQAFNNTAYVQKFQLLNGLLPTTRPIVVDPTPFLTGAPLPPADYETGWKDTVRGVANQIIKLRARWAPHELPADGVKPGENAYSFDPTQDPAYLWHCHLVGHEDHDMMRPLQVVNAWSPKQAYTRGMVVAYQNVNYRVRVDHSALKAEPPNRRFDQWERVNNNDGSWQPQIIYAPGDRVLHNSRLYVTQTMHQAQVGKTPDRSSLWSEVPTSACGQFVQFCHDGTTAQANTCHDLGHAGDETACLAQLSTCLSACAVNPHAAPAPTSAGHTHANAGPCSGLCANPTTFTVPDGTEYQSGQLGGAAGCYETSSQLAGGTCSKFQTRELTVNGKRMPCAASGHFSTPLPTERNHGYCIQTSAGGPANASFTAY